MRGNSYKSKRKTKSINKLIFIVPIIFIAAIVLFNLANGNIQNLGQLEGQEALKAGTTPTRIVIRNTAWDHDCGGETWNMTESLWISAQLQDASTDAILDDYTIVATTSDASVVELSGGSAHAQGRSFQTGTGYLTLVPKKNGTSRIGFNYLGNSTYAAGYSYIDVTVTGQKETPILKIEDANGNIVASAGTDYSVPSSGSYDALVTETSAFKPYLYKSNGISGIFQNVSITSSNGVKVPVSPTSVTANNHSFNVSPIYTNEYSTITVRYAGDNDYNAVTASFVVYTGKGMLVACQPNQTVTYDAHPHTISLAAYESTDTSLQNPLSGVTFKYGETEGNYSSSELNYWTGTHTIYYKASKSGYKTVYGNATLTINPSPINFKIWNISKNPSEEITNSTNLNVGENKELNVQRYLASNNYKIGPDEVEGTSVTSSNSNIVRVEQVSGEYNHYKIYGVAAGTATVTVSQAANEKVQAKTQDIQVTVTGTLHVTAQGYEGTYDGQPHGITVTCQENGATIKYGWFEGNYDMDSSGVAYHGEATVYYQVTKEGYETVTGSATIKINPAPITLKCYDENNNEVTNVTVGHAHKRLKVKAFDNNNQEVSLHNLNLATSNSNVVNIYSGRGETVDSDEFFYISSENPGTASVTISYPEYTGGSYGPASVSVNVTVLGQLEVTARGYTGTYDGQNHGITVTCKQDGATIKYGWSEGTYNLNSSGVIHVGEGTVYYQVTKEGYETVTGSATIKINPAPITIKIYDENGSEVTNTTVTKSSHKRFMPKVFMNNEEVNVSSLSLTTSDSNVAYGSTSIENEVDSGSYFQVNTRNAGTATITIAHEGSTTGAYQSASATLTVTVTNPEQPQPTDISNATITLSQTSYTYDGSAKTPTVTVKNGNTTLTKDTDYTVSYSNNTNAGTATVTVTGKGNYTGTKSTTFTITAPEQQQTNISNATITLSETSYTYDGNAKTPTVTVKNGNTTLTANTDYTVAITNNTDAGTAIVTVTGKGNYTGTKTANFTIAKKQLTVTAVSKTKTEGQDNPELTYNCSGNVDGQTPKFTGNLVTTATKTSPAGTYDIVQGSLALTDNGSFKAKNYTISYTKGTLTITAAGQGGETEKTVSKIEMSSNPDLVTYVKNVGILDVTGGKIKVTYTDGTSEVVNMTKNMVTGFDNTTVGTQTLTVTYNEKTTTYNVTIVDKTVSAIAIQSLPDIKQYPEGINKLDLTGAKIKVTYTDGTNEVLNVTEEMISGFDSSELGGNTIDVTYGGKEASFTVSIVEKTVTSINVYQLPTKTEYKKGETLDLTGGKIIVYFDNNKTEIVDMTADMIKAADSFDTVGTKTIKIGYEGQEITFTINVVEESNSGNGSESGNNSGSNNGSNNGSNSGNGSTSGDNTQAAGTIPQTGAQTVITTLVVGGIIVSIGVAGIKIYKHRDIK